MAKVPCSFSPDEEPEGGSDSNWIISYADMMTLLMAFFAIMFSFSKIDQEALDKVRESVSKELGMTVTLPFQGLYDQLKNLIDQKNLTDKIRVTQGTSSIVVVYQGSALFEAGSAELNSIHRDTISDLLDILYEGAKSFPIAIEGHTDDNPIANEKFPSNWELAGARAARVIRMCQPHFAHDGGERFSP